MLILWQTVIRSGTRKFRPCGNCVAAPHVRHFDVCSRTIKALVSPQPWSTLNRGQYPPHFGFYCARNDDPPGPVVSREVGSIISAVVLQRLSPLDVYLVSYVVLSQQVALLLLPTFCIPSNMLVSQLDPYNVSDVDPAWNDCQWSRAFNLLNLQSKQKKSVALVLKRTIQTERPPLVGEVNANFFYFIFASGRVLDPSSGKMQFYKPKIVFLTHVYSELLSRIRALRD
jgi:hypothetical protein